MSQQKIADSQRTWLMAAMAEWQTEGLLSSEQADRILARYETDEELSHRQRSRIVFVLLGMAAFLFWLAVFLVIGFNWEAMSRVAKLAVVLIAVAATHALGLFLRAQDRAPKLAELVSFLGCLLYGAGIWLVAQAFHIEAHYPDGVWWWAVGVLPFALCLDSLLCHLLFAVLLALWAGLEVFGFLHLSPWLLFGSWRWSVAAETLPLLALPGLIWAHRKGSPVRVGLYVALLAWWVILQFVASGAESPIVFWIGSAGTVLLILAEAFPRGHAMAVPYRVWGVLLSAGTLILLSSLVFWEYENQRRADWNDDSARSVAMAAFTEVVAILMPLVISVVVVLVTKRGEGSAEDRWREIVRRQGFPVGLGLCLALLAFWSLAVVDTSAATLVPRIVANLAMLGLAIYLVRVGVREDRVRPFGAGIVYILIWAFVRYIDLFSDAGGMLGAAALFGLCGAGLVVVAQFWSRARAVRQEGGTPSTAPVPYVGPAWIDRPARWVVSRARPILIGTAVAQVLLLAGMIALEAVPLAVGKIVLLHVTPVDPRDLFRGDYVILNYEMNRLNSQSIEGVPPTQRGGWTDSMRDRAVYVTLEPESDGKHWHAVKASIHQPQEGTYLRGRYTGDYRQPVQFGIEAYYVQEGQGLELERLQRANQLSAEIAVAPWGQAKLRRVIAEQ
jgi:uncharacterized membrane-anchored protein/uncharacterized membrane protein